MDKQDELIEKLTEIVASALSDNDIRPRVKEIINSVLIPAGLVFVDEDQNFPNNPYGGYDEGRMYVAYDNAQLDMTSFKKVTELRKVE